MADSSLETLLQLYAKVDKKSMRGRDPFAPILVITLCLFAFIGIFLKIKNPPPESIDEKISKIRTSFVIEEKAPAKPEPPKPKPVPPKPKPTPKEKPEPVDLSEKPLLAQKQDDIVEKAPQEQEKKPVRRVYGLKKVYSTGIGASGDASDAVIGKLGNTLATEIDTFVPTDAELKGQLVSITSVTSVPRIKVQVKPEYTKEMLEKRIEGVVRARIYIDSDGKVKKVIVLDDLGYGSKEKVHEACLKMIFEPALQGDMPVAVWQTIRFRFEMVS